MFQEVNCTEPSRSVRLPCSNSSYFCPVSLGVKAINRNNPICCCPAQVREVNYNYNVVPTCLGLFNRKLLLLLYYTHECTPTPTHIYIHAPHTHTHTHTHTYRHICVCTNTHTHIYIYIYVCIYICVCVCVYIHTKIHTHTLKYI